MQLEAALDHYRELVERYHRTLDLMSNSAMRRFALFVDEARQYADHIETVAPVGAVLDVGSGVGLPGVVIAAALPHRTVFLVERRRRRSTFLRIVVSKLELANAHVLEADVRDVGRTDVVALAQSHPAGEDASARLAGSAGSGHAASGGARGVGVVTAQAVAPLLEIYCLTRHLHDEHVALFSRKGPRWRDEVQQLAHHVSAGPAVRLALDVGGGGTLLAVEARGGLPCPRSG